LAVGDVLVFVAILGDAATVVDLLLFKDGGGLCRLLDTLIESARSGSH